MQPLISRQRKLSAHGSEGNHVMHTQPIGNKIATRKGYWYCSPWKGVLGNVSYEAEFHKRWQKQSVFQGNDWRWVIFVHLQPLLPLHYKIQSKFVITWDSDHIIHLRTFVTLKPVKGATPDLSSQIRTETRTTNFTHKLLDAVSGSTFFKQSSIV